MSFIDEYNYNRDRITENVAALPAVCTPTYGSSISFTSSNSSWRGSNYNQFVAPNGINSINAEMDLIFVGGKSYTQSLLKKIESVTSGVNTGDVAFYGTENCINFGEETSGVEIRLDTDYYRNFYGSQISDYNLKHISSDVYELSISLFNNRISPVLNNGMGFVADNTVLNTGSFNRFDVVDERPRITWNIGRTTGQYIDLSDYARIESSTDFDVSFSFVASDHVQAGEFASFDSSATNPGCYFFVDKSGGSRLYYNHVDKTLNMTLIGGGTMTWPSVNFSENKKYNIRIVRSEESKIRLYINGIQNTFIGTSSGYFRFNRIIGRWNVSTAIPSFMGFIFDISIKSGVDTVYAAKGDLSTTSLWSYRALTASYNYPPGADYSIFPPPIPSVSNPGAFNNYFYIDADRSPALTSAISGLATYTGVADNATRSFLWEPDQDATIPVDHSSRVNNFKKSFSQQLNISKNQNRIDSIDLKFSNRSQKETYSMLHFFESHLGYKHFVYNYGDDVISKERVFFCNSWKHTFNYKDSNTIEATFVEVVTPITPKF